MCKKQTKINKWNRYYTFIYSYGSDSANSELKQDIPFIYKWTELIAKEILMLKALWVFDNTVLNECSHDWEPVQEVGHNGASSHHTYTHYKLHTRWEKV